MANSVLRKTTHTSLARTFLNEIATRAVKYYFSYGKTSPWETETIPDALDTLEHELAARKNTVFLKEITPNDACLVIPRYNWAYGAVYDDYDHYSQNMVAFSGAKTLEDSIYYVLTDEYNVYKCLYNAESARSTIKPTGTSVAAFQTEDKYIWKFMYTIPTDLRNKFLSTMQMPVVVAAQNAYYSDGKIDKFTILSKGSGYKANKVIGGTVSSGSTNFRKLFGFGTKFLTASTPVGALWTANAIVYVGQIVYYSNRSYTVGKAGRLGINAPTHTTGTVANGTATLTYTSVLQYDTSARLSSGDMILVNGETRTIASVESDTELTISNNEPQLYVGAASQITKINTLLKITSGDGYKESNQYIITNITITDGGTGYGTDPDNVFVVFSEPTLPNGRVARGTAILSDSGSIIGVELDDAGYGYAVIPKIEFKSTTGLGSGATGVVDVIRSSAYIDPVINESTGEIINANIIDPGIGYTYCNVSVLTMPIQGTNTTDASITVDVNVGQINTQQASVELSAINGAIHVIKIEKHGTGYSDARVTITGDGSGCRATAIIEGGVIQHILVTNIGKDYTYATVTITSTGSVTSPASARAIISPPGGHGKNAIDELGGRTVLLYSRLETTPIKGFTIDTDYRQICLYKQPKRFASNLLYNTPLGSTCYKVTLDTTNKPPLASIKLNSEILLMQNINSTQSVRFTVIAINQTSLLLQAIDNNDELIKPGLFLKSSSGSIYYGITKVEKPEIEKLQGEMIYIDNRQPFRALDDQPVAISTRFIL
jgi:hypothetical protein